MRQVRLTHQSVGTIARVDIIHGWLHKFSNLSTVLLTALKLTYHPIVAKVLWNRHRRAVALDTLVVVVCFCESTSTEHVVNMAANLQNIIQISYED